jgi:hypothetical protein
MELDVLRFFAKAYIAETDSLFEEEKAELFDFLDEADEHEILAVLHTGEVPAPLTEQEMVYLEYVVGDEVNMVFEHAGMNIPFPVIYEHEPVELLEFYLQEAPLVGKAKEMGYRMRGAARDFMGKAKGKLQAKKKDWSLRNIKARGKAKIGVQKAALKRMPTGKKVGTALGAAAIVAAATAAAYTIYKKFMSKAAKECRGASNKQECMDKYRKSAVQAQIKTLQSQKNRCAQAKDPAKCRLKIDAKISKLSNKL